MIGGPGAIHGLNLHLMLEQVDSPEYTVVPCKGRQGNECECQVGHFR